MMHETIDIQTEDGTCPSHVFRPLSMGPWPAVLFYMDGIGMRPAMLEMAERIATHGYYVLLPDLFYRSGKYAPMNAKTVWSDPHQRKNLVENFMAKLGQANAMRDTRALLGFLAMQGDVIQPKVGVTGYCMGGNFALAAAGHFPSRVAVAASYHGGRLATDAPESPHLLAPQMKAKVYVAGAIEDDSFDDAQKARLEQALTDAGVDHTVETYQARHGWVPNDSPTHDAAAEKKHWETLLPLFDGVLK